MVVSNTTPFISLCSINMLHLMPSIFGSIVVASSVQEECKEGGKIFVPDLTVRSVQAQKHLPVLFELDRGERDTLFFSEALIHRIAANLGESSLH